jgi:putative oxidoreductase
MQKWYPTIGRVLLGLLFLGGAMKFMNIAGTTAFIASVGLPMATVVFWLSTLLEVGGALAIIFGFKTRIAAWALIAYTFLTIVFFHNPIADQMQLTQALKNLAIIGGLLMLIVHVSDKKDASGAM